MPNKTFHFWTHRHQFTDGSLYEGGWRDDVPEVGGFALVLKGLLVGMI